jgi:HK97 family phage prohead protease
MNEIFAYKSFSGTLEFKDVDGKKGIVTGYFASFETKDSENDIIRKGAFQKSITEQGPKSSHPRIKHLYNHDPFKPLGVITELKEDSRGLYYESKIGTHSLGVEFLKMAESGLITEHSIGYIATKSTGRKGINRVISEIKLKEGSSLSVDGVNPNTPLLSVKGELNLEYLAERQKTVENFCRKSDATDETIEMLLLHSRQLSQYIIDIKGTQPHDRTEPQTWNGWFNNQLTN